MGSGLLFVRFSLSVRQIWSAPAESPTCWDVDGALDFQAQRQVRVRRIHQKRCRRFTLPAHSKFYRPRQGSAPKVFFELRLPVNSSATPEKQKQNGHDHKNDNRARPDEETASTTVSARYDATR